MIQENQSDLSELAQLGANLYDRLIDAVRESEIHDVFGDVTDAVYVKSADGQIILSNKQYNKQFVGASAAIGRNPITFLDHSLFVLSKASDELVFLGADSLEFSHTGKDQPGNTLRMRTYKKSLLGIGHPRMAILGLTRIEQVIPSNSAEKIQSLSDSWKTFEKLDQRDQEIAKGIVCGRKVKALAVELDVSEKTIENRRNAIFRALSIDGPTDLVKIMVRLQDNGFCDFGL